MPPISRPIFPTRWATVAIGSVCLTTAVFAVDKDKALYVGGSPGFPSRSGPLIGITSATGNFKVEGKLDTKSEIELRFEAGRWGTLAIPYATISSLEFGLDPGKRVKGLLLFPPWDPTEQFTKNAHYLLTVGYRDPSGAEKGGVFELGKDLVRPTVDTLERRSGKAVVFLSVEACMVLKTAEECDYGQPTELKGLRKVFLEADIQSGQRELILAELHKENVGLEVVPDQEAAEIILSYRGEFSPLPECPCEGGRGLVSLTQGTRRRVVLVFVDRKTGVWGKKPAINFGRAFVDAFRSANNIR